MSYFEVVEMKQYYRVVTSALSHAENLHIFMNMLTFAYFGEQCEKISHCIICLPQLVVLDNWGNIHIGVQVCDDKCRIPRGWRRYLNNEFIGEALDFSRVLTSLVWYFHGHLLDWQSLHSLLWCQNAQIHHSVHLCSNLLNCVP